LQWQVLEMKAYLVQLLVLSVRSNFYFY
jgi:hypothetical protein